MVDPAYPLMVGSLYERLIDDYPHQERLPAADAPDELTPHIVKHRFRSKPDSWPVAQIGPGVATLNLTTEYSWQDFYARANRLISSLAETYKKYSDQTMTMSYIGLRYINSIDSRQLPVADFFRDLLHTQIVLPSVFNGTPPQQLAITFTQSFEDLPGTIGTVALGSSVSDKNVIIVDLQVNCSDSVHIPSIESIPDWLETAHKAIEEWFFALIDGELHRSFSQMDEVNDANRST
jgi:uncharacterized protein (TIGR04255 family)